MITGTLTLLSSPVSGRLYGPAGQELRKVQGDPPTPQTFAVLGLRGDPGPIFDIGTLPSAP